MKALFIKMACAGAFAFATLQMAAGQQPNPFPHNPDPIQHTTGWANNIGNTGPFNSNDTAPGGYPNHVLKPIGPTGPTGNQQGVIGTTDYIMPPTLNGPKKVTGIPGDMEWP